MSPQTQMWSEIKLDIRHPLVQVEIWNILTADYVSKENILLIF